MKRICTFLTVLAMVLTLLIPFPITVTAETATSGTTGDCTWTLDGTVLTISGNGPMADYMDIYSKPWGESVTEVIILDGVTTIGDYVFCNCNVTSVTIPNTVTSIGDYAFASCDSLTSITIPNSVTTIGDFAFSQCAFTSISIPGSITSIGYCAFNGCTKMTGVYITDLTAWCKIYFNETAANPLCYAHKLYLNGTLLTKLEIPEEITEVKDFTFTYCYSITSVIIPDCIKSIGSNAFYGCSKLSALTIPHTVTFIGEYAFDTNTTLTVHEETVAYTYALNNQNPYNLTEHNIQVTTIPSTCTKPGQTSEVCTICGKEYSLELPLADHSIEDGICTMCGNIGTTGDCTWTLDGTTLTISGEGRMADYTACGPWGDTISKLVIQSGVTHIGAYSFDWCYSLTSITLPDSIISIGDHAFARCISITSANLGKGLTTIGASAFRSCSKLITIVIPDNVVSIGDHAFYDCSRVSSMALGNNLSIIGNYAFAQCFSLTSARIPDSVISIGNFAFYICPSLQLITLGSSLKNIGKNAFYLCNKLTSVTIPQQVTSIGANAFDASDELYIHEGSEGYSYAFLYGNPYVIESHTYEDGICTVCQAIQPTVGGTTNTTSEVIRLLKHIDGHDVGLTDEDADINGDGKVTIFDAVYFLQLLNSTPIE